MNKLRQVMLYLCNMYPHKDELSNARLTKLIYLADWKSAIERGRQITEIEWEFSYYGPYVSDVIEIAESDNSFYVESETNPYGEKKSVIRCKRGARANHLDSAEVSILKKVIAATEDKTWDDFIRLVYSTYPIKTVPQFSQLDLPRLAKQYVSQR